MLWENWECIDWAGFNDIQHFGSFLKEQNSVNCKCMNEKKMMKIV